MSSTYLTWYRINLAAYGLR